MKIKIKKLIISIKNQIFIINNKQWNPPHIIIPETVQISMITRNNLIIDRDMI